jgi:hypothetical protein
MSTFVSPKDIADFDVNGFLRIPALIPQSDLSNVQQLLDPLFERFDSLPRGYAVDIAAGDQTGAPRIPEVSRPTTLAPALRDSETFHRCQAVANALLGAPTRYVYDHAIYKAPHNQAATAWHQDAAYSTGGVVPRTAHFWIPLQEATVENGCMWFIPGSHRQGLIPHDQVAKHVKGGVMAASKVDESSAVTCPIPVGGVTIHHPLTLHYTGANNSDHFRRVWVLQFGVVPRFEMLNPRTLLSKIARRLGRGS